jgi:2',3'-cyclic-nucleotide 2'-phosphodiesterase (5'-nucleotidase family)
MTKRLVVYHTSDIHAATGFGKPLAALVEPGSLLVDCGDALAGSSVLYRRREPIIEELRAAPYAAMAVGNREFHYLHGCMAARARALPMPLLCSNLIDLRGRPACFARELTLDARGVTVRLLALLAPQYRTGSGWERIFGWRFIAPQLALDHMLAAPSSADVTILLSHLGLDADHAIARRAPNLAAILGGHTHEALWQPHIENGIPIAHPGAYGYHVGRLELALDGSIAAVTSYQLLPLREAAAVRERTGERPPLRT